MRNFSFLIIALSLMSQVAFATNTTEEVIVDASLPPEFLKLDTLITKDDFIKANKEMQIQHINDLCTLIGNSLTHRIIHSEIDITLEKNSVDKSYFIERGYANVRCYGNSFLIQAMHNDRIAFKKFLEYGFNLNRPLQFSKKVGTPLDFAFAEYYRRKSAMATEHKPENNPAQFHGYITQLKKMGAKTCKELALKCDISY